MNTYEASINEINQLFSLMVKIDTPEEVFEHVCTTLGLDKDFVRSASRKTEVVEASQIAAVLIRDNFKLGLSAIGRIVKAKPLHYSSVIHKHRQHEDWIATDRGYREKFNRCKIYR